MRSVMMVLAFTSVVLVSCNKSEASSVQAPSPQARPWEWNGLALRMAEADALPIIQKLCGWPTLRRPEPALEIFFETSELRCATAGATYAEVPITFEVQFFGGKVLSVFFSEPRGAGLTWWPDLVGALDKKYGKHSVEKGAPDSKVWRSGDLWLSIIRMTVADYTSWKGWEERNQAERKAREDRRTRMEKSL
jgi:hypothetical protein